MATYYYAVQFFKGTDASNSNNYISSTSPISTNNQRITLETIQNAASGSMPSGYTWNNSANPVAKANCTISGAYVTIKNPGYNNCAVIAFFVKKNSTPTPTYQWKITFYKNDGSNIYTTRYTDESSIKAIRYTIPNVFWTRTGYTFQCWTENSNGTGTAYYATGVATLKDDLTVYAYWKKNTTYTGTITLSDTTYISGTAGNVTVNVSNLNAGSGRWSIVVNGVTKVEKVSGGNYTFQLDYLYDGQTSSKYTIYLVDPDGDVADSFNISHKTKPTITYIVKAGGVTGGHVLSTTITVNGTSFSANSRTVNQGDTVSISVTFEDGYEFEGWYTTTSGTTKVTGNHPYYINSISSNVTLYAKGQLKQYTYYYRIYLYLNGSQYGDPAAGSLQTTSSNGYGLSLASAQGLISDQIENNWTFDSSTTSNTTNNPSYSNGYFVITGGSTSRTVCKLYYTLTYTLQARIGTNQSIGIQSVSVNPSSVKPNGEATWTCALKSNYIFQGWYKNAACTQKEVEGANYQTYLKENINDDIILYAAAYTTSYPFYAEPYSGHDNYFSSITINNQSSIEANVGDSITWKCVLASPNYTFDGWYTSSGTRISTNLEYSTIVTNSQAFFTLYAKANVYNYTITYRDLEHGLLRYQDTPSSAETSFYYRLWSCPSDWKLQMAEYNFNGWKEESTSNEYEENEQILLNSNNRSRTFNAIWSKKEEQQTFTITYIYNNTEEGAPTPSPVRVKDTTSAITPGQNSVQYRLLSINDSRFSTWTNEKFTFEGWRNLTTGLINEENEVITVSQNINFETVWSTNTKTTYTLKYNKGNISENISIPSLQTTSSYSSSQQFEINPNSNDPTTVGQYKFKGWGTDLNNSSTRYYKGDYITLYKNTNPIQTLYAQWEEISTSVTYKITYHSNNISSVSNMPSPNPQAAENITADSYTFTIPNITPTCNWQKFQGWGLSSSSTTPAYLPNQTITLYRNSPELELYAIWSQSLYFTWTTSEADDAVQIQKGKPFCITSQKWNDFNKLIKDYLKPSYNRTLVQQGWQFSYIYMRETLTALQGLANDPFPGFTDSSDPIDRNKPIKASYFTELKTYLNNKLKNP